MVSNEQERLEQRLDEIDHRLDCHDRALEGMWRMIGLVRSASRTLAGQLLEAACRLLHEGDQ